MVSRVPQTSIRDWIRSSCFRKSSVKRYSASTGSSLVGSAGSSPDARTAISISRTSAGHPSVRRHIDRRASGSTSGAS